MKKYSSRIEWALDHGFNKDLKTFLYIGNTYPYKEQLKAAGAKFDKLLKWHSPTAINLGTENPLIPAEMDFNDVYLFNPMIGTVEVKEHAEDTVSRIIIPDLPHKNSDFYGEVGQRYTETLHLENRSCYTSYYGDKVAYTFTLGENVLVWFTDVWLDEDVNDFTLAFTVKKHDVYKGRRQTIITRGKRK